jgi:hypothetical protein
MAEAVGSDWRSRVARCTSHAVSVLSIVSSLGAAGTGAAGGSNTVVLSTVSSSSCRVAVEPVSIVAEPTDWGASDNDGISP